VRDAQQSAQRGRSWSSARSIKSTLASALSFLGLHLERCRNSLEALADSASSAYSIFVSFSLSLR
jgi:hypothetical protein